ncbi:hypothetical protein AC579_5606 [Pseudocercospora musae]|uniref:Uncharacterized protein n=1 Tax=Pseudocercospora musae TaxID=113226 RepID=A0A139INN6_9PEZI|nr:hypothetical protein AC579_5606 [Pseudocercospora musae]
MADPTKTASDATKNLPGGAGGDVAKTDPAKGDVLGSRNKANEGSTVSSPEVFQHATSANMSSTQVDKEEKKNSLRINIELDIDIEIHLTARIKGDITIGLLGNGSRALLGRPTFGGLGLCYIVKTCMHHQAFQLHRSYDSHTRTNYVEFTEFYAELQADDDDDDDRTSQDTKPIPSECVHFAY